MSVDIEKAMHFIGHSSSYPELDDFLLSSGVKIRLTAKDLPSAIVYADDNSVAFQFTSSYSDTYGPTRSKGFLFLEDVTVLNKKFNEDVGTFAGGMPLGLSLEMTEKEIRNLLGNPTSEGEFLKGYFLTYDNLIDGLSINIKADLSSRQISFIRFMPLEV
jgi:hypothetical protein